MKVRALVNAHPGSGALVRWKRPLLTVAALVGSLVASGLVLELLGANPFESYWLIITSALASNYGLTQTLLVTVPLVLAGLAALIPIRARLWNVGGDGQLNVGAVASITVGLRLSHGPPTLVVLISLIAGVAAGALYALVPGLLRALLNANEIIVAFMLNFMGLLVVQYAIGALSAPGAAYTTQSLPPSIALPNFGVVNLSLLIAVVVAVLVWGLMDRTRLGFAIRAVGANRGGALLAGFDVKRITIAVFVLGGACAGLAGALLVLGEYHDVNSTLSSNYGLMGVAIALIARLRPIWIVPVSFLIAVVTVGGSTLSAIYGISDQVPLMIVSLFAIVMMGFRLITLRYPEI